MPQRSHTWSYHPWDSTSRPSITATMTVSRAGRASNMRCPVGPGALPFGLPGGVVHGGLRLRRFLRGVRGLLQIPVGDAVPDPLNGGGQTLLQRRPFRQNGVLVLLRLQAGLVGVLLPGLYPAAQLVQGILPGGGGVSSGRYSGSETGSGPAFGSLSGSG